MDPLTKTHSENLPSNFKFIKSCKNFNLIALVSDKQVDFMHNNKQSSIKDDNCEEIFTCVDFINKQNILFACIGGTLGIIKIINVFNGTFHNSICAHTGGILDIKCTDRYIITTSDDCSIKFWDFDTLSCIKIFAGHEFKNSILTLDFLNDKLLCAGIDCKIFECEIKKNTDKFIFEPLFVGCDLHRSAISKIKYCNHLIVSLSLDGRISIIKPTYTNKFNFVFLKEIIYDDKIIDFEIYNDQIFCLTLNKLYNYNIAKILEESNHLNINVESSGDFLCLTANREFIYILTKTNTLEIIENIY